MSALIAAHEMGHHFGAPHDGEAGACRSTPQTFLLAPRLSQSDQFSACGVQQIQPAITTATCLTAYIPPDAGPGGGGGRVDITLLALLAVALLAARTQVFASARPQKRARISVRVTSSSN